MKTLHIDPFVQFVEYDPKDKEAYIQALFAYLLGADKSITMYLSSVNTVQFDDIFESEVTLYKELEKHIIASDIKYKALVGLHTSKFYKSSGNEEFYADARGKNDDFFACNTFKHFQACMEADAMKLYFEGRPLVNNDNVVIIDDSLIILEQYDYDDEGEMVPINFLLAGDKRYIDSMSKNFESRLKKKNKYDADLM